jgi:pimeloyl-ACP methyl ester carboxylesterase
MLLDIRKRSHLNMTEPKLNFLPCPDPGRSDGQAHQMAYWQWGDASASHVVLCVHGLTRQGRDFDALAQHLRAQARAPIRVICPDVAGRGRSDRLQDPQTYIIPTYAADMLVLLRHLHLQAPMVNLDWVGTSMGGLIGLALCGSSPTLLPVPVRKLILNDVGPALAWPALQRIGASLGQLGPFDTLQQAADTLWGVSSGFGPHTPTQWLDLCRYMVQPHQGKLVLGYDPDIALAFRSVTPESASQSEAMLWSLYDAIQAHTLVLRGANSDLLTPATVQEMARRGPRAACVVFDGVGHAPTLVDRLQQGVVSDFLLGATGVA